MPAFVASRPHPSISCRSGFFAALSLALSACGDSPAAADGCARPLRLAPGEAADVQPAPECPLKAQGGAEYVLAYYDARLADGAQTGPEPYGGVDERFVVMVDDVTAGARAASSPVPSADWVPAPAPGAFRLSYAAGGPAHVTGVSGTGPWSVGDEVPFRRTDCTTNCPAPLEARVARVFDGWLVFAVSAAVGAEAERVVAMFDQYAPVLRQHGLPLMHAAFATERPVTTAESGQLVVVFDSNVTSVDGVTSSEVRAEGAATHWIRLEMSPELDGGRLLSLLAHEVAHAFQAEFLARNRPLSGDLGSRGGARWGIEGGATLVETETLRRAAGLPLQGNLDYGAAPATEVEAWLYRNAGARNGALTAGYHSSAPFLRDLVLRRVAAGDEVGAAFREVLRGAVEGWYGIAAGGRRTGLTERMRARLPGWQSADAVLTWTLSAAADDRVATSIFQDRTWLRTGDWEGRGRGWGPDRLIQAGSGVSERVTRPVGSSGYLLVRSPAAELALALTAPESVRWKLLRVS